MTKNQSMRVKFSKKFKKQFDKAGKKVGLAFENRLQLFLADPSNPILRNHQLSGRLSSYFSINVGGDWRAIYSLQREHDGVVAVFEMIGTHSQLYRWKILNSCVSTGIRTQIRDFGGPRSIQLNYADAVVLCLVSALARNRTWIGGLGNLSSIR